MKKVYVFIFLLTLILGMGVNVSAATNQWEGYGGLSYYSLDEDEVGIDFSIGLFAGARKWSFDDLAFGAELDYTNYSVEEVHHSYYEYYDYKFDVSLTGFLGTVTYKVSDNISLNGALGYYRSKVNSNSENDLGMKFGVETGMLISDNVDLVGKVSYRILEIEEADFGGVELSVALTRKF